MKARNNIDLKAMIRTIPDYPKPGILFRDITTLIGEPAGFPASIEGLIAPYKEAGVTHVAGIEARGFIFGAAAAVELGVGFVPVRKKGKLPGKVVGREYELEYGTDRIEIHEDALKAGDKVLLIDDLIATGGTAAAAVELIREVGAEVVATAFVIDLPDIGGADRLRALDVDVHSLIAFEGH